jgi:hypothetical protein
MGAAIASDDSRQHCRDRRGLLQPPRKRACANALAALLPLVQSSHAPPRLLRDRFAPVGITRSVGASVTALVQEEYPRGASTRALVAPCEHLAGPSGAPDSAAARGGHRREHHRLQARRLGRSRRGDPRGLERRGRDRRRQGNSGLRPCPPAGLLVRARRRLAAARPAGLRAPGDSDGVGRVRRRLRHAPASDDRCGLVAFQFQLGGRRLGVGRPPAA